MRLIHYQRETDGMIDEYIVLIEDDEKVEDHEILGKTPSYELISDTEIIGLNAELPHTLPISETMMRQ